MDLPTDWSSPARAPLAMSKQQQPMEDFIDDFDDDDDAFFGATSQPQRESEGKGESVSNTNSFGMISLSYGVPRSSTANSSAVNEEDSVELQEIEPHLAHLRNLNSSYRNVAASCLVINQSLYNDYGGSVQNARTVVIHNKHFEKYMQRIIEALSACLEHNCPAARILAAKTLGMFLRSSVAVCEFDPRLLSEIIEDRIQDYCLGAAYTLVNAALEGDDGVSSAALESLGLFTVDAQSNSLAAEIYALAENGDPNPFIYKEQNTASSNAVMKEIQIKVYNNVVFPRMSKLLHRLTLLGQNNLAKALPVITSTFESALTEGTETIPARRAIESTKTTHGKRGWFETDASSLIRDYVEILLGCMEHKKLTRAAAVACIRLVNVSPSASWRGKASLSAAAALVRLLNEETALVSSDKSTGGSIHSTLSAIATPSEMIGGTLALLLISLRGIPLRERAAGLVSALRAVMLFLPMGIVVQENQPLDASFDFVDTHRLRRVGLMAEIASLIIVEGRSNIDNLKADELIGQTVSADDNADKSKEKILGERAMLLSSILQSRHLSSIWDTQQKKNNRVFRPVDELVWVFCSSLLHMGFHKEHIFSKDFSYLIEWCNLALVMLDSFGKFVCRPMTSSPFSHAAHASYMDLMTSLMKKSGLVPPFDSSLRDNMLPAMFLTDSDANNASTTSVVSSRLDLPVVGGPGRQMPHVSSALSRVCQNILVLWSKARTAYPIVQTSPGGQSCGNIIMAAILVDAWLGRCIMNHDAKLSNENQLEAASSLLALIQIEMNSLLENHAAVCKSNDLLASLIQDDPSSYFNATVHLFHICMASLEAVAKMSVLLWDIESRNTRDDVEVFDDKVGPLAVSILHAFMETSNGILDASANAGRDVMFVSFCQQVSIDANDTIARIVEFSPANAKQQSHHDDIATHFQPSPFLSSKEGLRRKVALENMLHLFLNCFIAMPRQEKKASFNDLSFSKELSSSLISRLQPMHQSSFFLYHQARLVISRLMVSALKEAALAFPSTTASPLRDVHQTNPYRLSTPFLHHTVEMYYLPRDLPAFIPTPSRANNTEPMLLTGCSDPVSLTMSYEFRRLRKGDLSEESTLVVTTRVYNITPVSIRNGINLDLTASLDNDSSWNGLITATYKNEITGGDFITWETRFGGCKAGNILLQASVTFRDMEQESITRKLVSLDDEVGASNFIQEEDDDVTEDITITCQPVKVPAVAMLQPCPLVFFGSKQRHSLNRMGDEVAFRFLWSNMKHECSKSIVYEGSETLKFADKLGCVMLEASSGCAFITPDSIRVFCVLESKNDNSNNLLRLRSDSVKLIQSLVGAMGSQSEWLAFLFGPTTAAMLDSSPNAPYRPKYEHDFPSMTLPHHQLEHYFASMAVPHHQLDVFQ